ncbi:MAG: Ig-like domain repeat protein, partial [Deltaproteobacteria bacterium]|nr:Ig-like domain repeat protein [Deltaproteobacteria bacterium]
MASVVVVAGTGAANTSAVCPEGSVGPTPTQLLYVGATDGSYGDPLELVALLSDASGLPLAARSVTFMLGGQGAAVVTDANGVASATITPLGLPGPTAVTATFAGDAEADGAQAAATVTIAREATLVRLLGAEIVPVGMEGEVRAQLVDDEGDPVAGRTLAFTYGTTTVTATTGADGTAVALLAAPAAGSTPLTVSFAGDAYYEPASRSGTALPYQPTAFVIWGGNAGGLTIGQRVNFWGHSWATQVTGGDYAGHSDFKGFAPTLPHFAICQADAHTATAPLLTQDCWSTKPGQSFPAATLPEHIGVLVATAIAKSGKLDYGNIAGLAVVRVEPGYGPSPGKAGWGTIVELVGPAAPATTLNVSQTQPLSVLPGESFEVTTTLQAVGARALDVQVSETFSGATPATGAASLGTIELGATVTTTFALATAPLPPRQAGESSAAYQSRLGAADGRLVAAAGLVTFADDAGGPGLPVDVRSTSRLDLPRLRVSLQAPGCAGPGTVIDYVVAVANVGSAPAAAAQAVVTLPDGSSVTVDFAALAPGESATRTVTWMVPLLAPRAAGESAAEYVARLQAVDGRALGATVAATWTDALGGAYGAVDQPAITIERLPILVATAGTLPDVLPGQSAPLSVTVENIGSGNATGAQLQVADNAPTTFALAAGTSSTVTATATAPTLAPRGADESDAEYRARLAAASNVDLSFGWTLGWSTPEASFGTLEEVAVARQVLPLLDVALEAPLQAGVGDTITYAVRVTNAGSAGAAAATATFTAPDGTTTELAFGAVGPAESATQTATFTVPAPSLRGAGESNADYVARLLALQAGLAASLSVTWTDAAANAYGPRAAAVATAVALPVLSLATGTLPAFLPGQAQPLALTMQNLGAAEATAATVRLTNPDGTVTSTSFALAAGATTTVMLAATAPAVAPKGAGESDAAYRARLAALSGSGLSFAVSLDWTSPTAAFGT